MVDTTKKVDPQDHRSVDLLIKRHKASLFGSYKERELFNQLTALYSRNAEVRHYINHLLNEGGS